MPKHKEDDLQASVFDWAKLYKMPESPDIEQGAVLADYLFHVPNGGKRNVREAARLKRQGVKAGVYDLMLNVARGGYHGLDIELKIKPNKLTDNQKIWCARMNRAGRLMLVCNDLNDVIQAVQNYLRLRDI